MANIKDFKDGTKVMHVDWNPHTSEGMKVKRKGKKIFLCLDGEEDTEYNAGGETEDGWFAVDSDANKRRQ